MRVILTLTLFFSSGFLLAQQRAQYSQFALNNYLQNPAITGIEDYTDVRLGFRNQWVGIEGAPRSLYMSAHMPVNKKNVSTEVNYLMRNGRKVKTIVDQKTDKSKNHKIKPHQGVGFLAESDKSGAISRTGLNLTYAYHLPVSRTVKVAGGVSAGILNYSINTQSLVLDNTQDPALAGNGLRNTQFDLGLGIWAYSRNFFGGISTSQFASKKENFINDMSIAPQNGLQTHYYFSGGYRINVSPFVALIPSFLTKLAQPSPASTDFNLKALYNDRVYIGGTYRKDDAFSVITGFNINSIIGIGYAYDATTSELNYFSQGSHEVVLNIKLLNKNKAICPNWLW